MALQQTTDSGLRELALFAGSGGGILGGKILGWRTVCAVELDAYARAVLRARQIDGALPFFPIFDDVRFLRFNAAAGVIYDCRYYEDGSKNKALPEGERTIRIGNVYFRSCDAARDNSAGNVGMDEGQGDRNAAQQEIRNGECVPQGRKNSKRKSARPTGESSREGDCPALRVMRAMWTPWTIPGWEDGYSGAPPGLQRPIAGYVAMSEMSPCMAQEFQSNREEIIYGEPDRIAYVGNIDVVSGGFP